MATSQDLKDFFALTGNNPVVTDSQLLDVQAWLDHELGKTGSDADALVDFIYRTIRTHVRTYKRQTFNPTWV